MGERHEQTADSTAAIDFGEIVGNIRYYVDPTGSGQTPFSLDATDEGITPTTLTNLIHGIHQRDIEPETCVFYLPHQWYNEFRMCDDVHTYGGGNSFQGRPIRTHATVPEDVALFLAPDAVGLGGRVYNPLPVAYADVGSPPE